MEQLKTRLNSPEVRGVARAESGEIREFHRKGVIDLFTLLTTEPTFLRNASLADRVIGRGAALLLVKGGVREVFSYVMSQPAMDLLQANGIAASCETLQPYIVNRTGDGICPVEQLTLHTDSPEQAYLLIKDFINQQISKS